MGAGVPTPYAGVRVCVSVSGGSNSPWDFQSWRRAQVESCRSRGGKLCIKSYRCFSYYFGLVGWLVDSRSDFDNLVIDGKGQRIQ